MYKLLAIDLDGTLLNSDNEVSKENIEWIRRAREKGVYILLVSGRPYISMKGVAKSLNLEECFIIAMAGCDIRRYPSGESINHSCLTKKQVGYMHKIAIESKKHLQVFRLDGSYYFHQESKYSKMYASYFKYEGLRADLLDIPYDDVCKGMFIMDKEEMEEMEIRTKEVFSKELRAESIWETIIDVYPSSASKGTGIKHIAKELGIYKEDIIAVGDEKVDLSMFKEAGLSVAMGNATESVKAAADVVTLSNDEHGVAEVIKKYIM